MAAEKLGGQDGIVGRPLVFGEIVFDEFDDGEHRAGGAPLNGAWHLRGFGLDPVLISRVGADALGGLVLERLRVAGLDMRHVDATAFPNLGKERWAFSTTGRWVFDNRRAPRRCKHFAVSISRFSST